MRTPGGARAALTPAAVAAGVALDCVLAGDNDDGSATTRASAVAIAEVKVRR
jgi:hypothetical protein